MRRWSSISPLTASVRVARTVGVEVAEERIALCFGLRSGETSLQGALTLAEPEGYIRIFVDEGQPMASLLRAAAKKGIAPGYVRRLLAAVNKTADAAPVQPGLIEPLSDRELDVLRLLGTDLNGPDIARELTVSLSTVRTHTNRIYAKLGVNNRRAAVRQAQQLDLMPRTRDR